MSRSPVPVADLPDDLAIPPTQEQFQCGDALRYRLYSQSPKWRTVAAKKKFLESLKTKKGGFVYFIQSGPGGPIKIGFASNPLARLAELQVGNPHPLAMLLLIRGTRRDEYLTAYNFAGRIRGEWFHPSQEILAYIESMRFRAIEIEGVTKNSNTL